LQEREQVLKVAKGQDSGESTLASFAEYDPESSSLKMSQCSMFEDSMSSSLTLPRAGTMRSGKLYQRSTPERPTSEYDFSSSDLGRMVEETKGATLVPTPTAQDGGNAGNRNLEGSKANAGVSLCDMVSRGGSRGEMLPTPTAASYGSSGNGTRPDGTEYKHKGKPSLDTMAAKGLWPMPTTQDAKNTGGSFQYHRRTVPLNAEVSRPRFPTPLASEDRAPSDGLTRALLPEYQSMSARSGQAHPKPDYGEDPAGPPPPGGKLNPRWVAWLMGFPIEFLNSAALEMPSSPSAQRSWQLEREKSSSADSLDQTPGSLRSDDE